MKKLTTFWKSVIGSFVMVGILAYFDIWAKNSGLFKQYYVGLPGQEAWWPLYQQYALTILIILPILYYLIIKKDKSESIAIFLSSYIMWKFGLEDVLYYWLQAIPIDSSLPWLNGMAAVHTISVWLGQATVTSTTLLVSVAVGFGVVYLMDKILLKVN